MRSGLASRKVRRVGWNRFTAEIQVRFRADDSGSWSDEVNGRERWMDDAGEVTESTRRAESDDALAQHRADRAPTEEEETVAAGEGPLDEGVREHYEDMAKRGAAQRGEGRIE
jgi:hypothetical protein